MTEKTATLTPLQKKWLSIALVACALLAPALIGVLALDNIFITAGLLILVAGSFILQYERIQMVIPSGKELGGAWLIGLLGSFIVAGFASIYLIYALATGTTTPETLRPYVPRELVLGVAVIAGILFSVFGLSALFRFSIERIERGLRWSLAITVVSFIAYCGIIALYETAMVHWIAWIFGYFVVFGILLSTSVARAEKAYFKRCRKCGETFANRKEFKAHWRLYHTNKKTAVTPVSTPKNTNTYVKNATAAQNMPPQHEQDPLKKTAVKKKPAKKPTADVKKAAPKKQSAKNGRYEYVEELSIGGMAIVDKYRDTKTEKLCIVKHPIRNEHYKFNVEKLKSEAKILSKLTHPNIVRYVDTFRKNKEFHLVEAYVDGPSLNAAYRNRGAGAAEVKKIGLQILNALEYIHKNGAIHRDLNPNNVIMSNGNAVIIDFGTAKTSFGSTAVFTYGYAAPEQMANNYYADGRSDVYSVGATMYFIATGTDPNKVHATDPLPPIRGISPALMTIINKATEADAGMRYQSAQAMRIALEYLK